MKYIPVVAGILLGLLFIMASVVVLFHLVPMPPLPEGSPVAVFNGIFFSTGYMTFVKVFELIGGILVAKTAPDPMTLVVVLLALYLLWCGRKAFAGLLN